jgi:hypothetical protein
LRKSAQILALFLFLLSPALVKADPVVINFDSPLPANAFYQSEGVVFHTVLASPSGELNGAINNVIALLPSPAAVSPPNGAFAVPVNPQFNGVNGIMANFVFTTGENVVVPSTTQSLSFNVIGSQGTWTVLFFDITSDNHLDSTTGLIGTITGDTDQVVSFSFAAGIHRFVFLPSGVNIPEGIDNLQFEATSVPEPASLVLLTVGIGGILARKRRKAISRIFSRDR